MSTDAYVEQDQYEEADEDYEDGDEEYEDGDDFDAEAEEMARRLQEQLRADIAKAQLEVAAAAAAANDVQPAADAASQPSRPAAEEAVPTTSLLKKKEAALATMKTILAFADKDSLLRRALSSTTISDLDNVNLLVMLSRCSLSGKLSKHSAKPLSEAVVSLAKSEALFASLRNSNASSVQLNKGKRQREEESELPPTAIDYRAPKRFAFEPHDLRSQVVHAVQVISQTLASVPPSAIPHPPDPALVSSIQTPLHHAFLFAVTSTPRAHPSKIPALQELGSLVQMLGVLTGVPIGSAPSPDPYAGSPFTTAPAPDLGTAVYPCLAPGCPKTFHRLFSLRAHQRAHAVSERPFRCALCPASFVRNHDLKRHARLHEKRAWRCGGCDKIFSRRDAIKRHKDARGRGAGKEGSAVCAYADVEEVEVERDDGEEDTRRAKIWSGITASEIPDYRNVDDGIIEEGEVDPRILFEAQDVVLQLLGPLQAYVSRGQGVPLPPVPPPQAGPSPAFATLANALVGASRPPAPAPAASAQSATVAEDSVDASASSAAASLAASLSLSWLSDEQTRLLEQAIADAASAAQAQAEAEAALEEEDEDFDEDEEGDVDEAEA